ncbi:potassium/proton antiporter [Eubacterium barkeri]|uniref:Cell volume regulation protein A n=1 Tax=Eubacterium barkeri TaxID=1528 RepID=A0A1H3DGW4_EUBBA|nr:potassium/proton antiporter [Eubacterium barkeri]SDX65703.1 cell volume regulation protein A [Eubacterium barkeri]
MTDYLLLIAVAILCCLALYKLSDRMGIPVLLAFIFLGMAFGTDGILRIDFDNYALTEQVCSVALIFIIFYGGFGTRLAEARSIVGQATLLSTLGVVVTAGLTAWFCHGVLGFSWGEGWLAGAVLSATDAASVFSILRMKRLNLKYHTASLLEVESGSNDPIAYMLTVSCIGVILGTGGTTQILGLLASQLCIGGLAGFLFARGAGWLLKRVHLPSGFTMALVVAITILAYALPTRFGGNGYLSVYLLGIGLGNVDFVDKRALVHFFDGVTDLMQMAVFFALGLLAFPSRLPEVFIPALCIGLFITLAARPAMVFALMAPFRAPLRQCMLVSWAGLRGASSMVFMTMAMLAVDPASDLFHMVFLVVLGSILFQGTLLPWIARHLDMIDAKEDVMKTFSDYSETTPVKFLGSILRADHPWCGCTLNHIQMPPCTIIALIQRGPEFIIPTGSTILKVDDRIILCAKTTEDLEGVRFEERKLEPGDKMVGKPLSELSMEKRRLVIMVQREDRIIIPKGSTVLAAGDILVITLLDQDTLLE